MKVRANLDTCGDVYVIAITAPGDATLPRDSSGTVKRAFATAWNRSARRRWRSLHAAAAGRVRRSSGPFSLALRTWEFQRRGVLHLHVVLRAATGHQRHQAHLYVQALDDLRELHDFGFVDRGTLTAGKRRLERVEAGRASAYLAGYLAPMKGGKVSITETVKRPDCPAHLIHVDRRLTTRTGITMRSLRLRRAAWCELRKRNLDPEDLDADWTPDTWRIIATGTHRVRGP